jgi:spermidine synthase
MRNLEWFEFAKDPLNDKLPLPDFWLKGNRDNAKDDARIVASILGLGASGVVAPITAAWSEPPYAFVGLGPGTLFTYAHPYQWVDAYELNPAIIALSEGESPVFHYYHSAQKRGVQATLHAGDGRRALAKAGPENFYHVLFVDAFNSNAIPTHLLTQQAIETYFQKLVPDGVVCIHTSNRNLEIARVLEQVSRRLDIAMTTLQANVNDNDAPTLFGSEWVVLARSKEVLRKWEEGGAFEQKPKEPRFPRFNRHRDLNALVWTDEHASQFAAVRDGQPIFNFIYGMLGLLLAFAAIMALIEMLANSAAPVKKRTV